VSKLVRGEFGVIILADTYTRAEATPAGDRHEESENINIQADMGSGGCRHWIKGCQYNRWASGLMPSTAARRRIRPWPSLMSSRCPPLCIMAPPHASMDPDPPYGAASIRRPSECQPSEIRASSAFTHQGPCTIMHGCTGRLNDLTTLCLSYRRQSGSRRAKGHTPR
jgi:hypothetical protein